MRGRAQESGAPGRGSHGSCRFVYRGQQVAFEADTTGTIGLKYTCGGTDQLLAITDGGTHYYVTTGGLEHARGLPPCRPIAATDHTADSP